MGPALPPTLCRLMFFEHARRVDRAGMEPWVAGEGRGQEAGVEMGNPTHANAALGGAGRPASRPAEVLQSALQNKR